MSFILMAVLYLLASPNLVARDRPTVVVETYTKCTHRLDAFSCWADGESNSDSSRVAIPAGLLDGVLGTYTAAGYSVLLYQVVGELPLLLEARVLQGGAHVESSKI